MEGTFAKELYSDFQLSKVELNPSSTTIKNCDDNDLQDEDGSDWCSSGEELDKFDLGSEWERSSKQMHTMGYRDGLIAGKEASAQEGFNIGFKQSVMVGYEWGNCRGVTSAIACLPDGLRAKLIDTEEQRNKFEALHESTHSLSTAEALKLYYDDIVIEESVEKNMDAEASSDAECLQNQNSDCTMGNYVQKFQTLLLKSPKIDSHLSVNYN